MPRPTSPTDGLAEDQTVKFLITGDVATQRRIDAYIADNPDVASRSAAVRKVFRDWERRRKPRAKSKP